MILERFFSALSYFTRLPSPYGQDKKPPSGTSSFAPLIGWVVGALSGVVFVVAERYLSEIVAVALSMAAGVWLTRALHEDGWADFCDGFGGAWDREATLNIMRDPTCGVFAVLGLILILLIKFVGLVEITGALLFRSESWMVVLILISAHAVSRLAAVSMMCDHDYAGDPTTTRAGQMSSRMSAADFAIALVGGLLPLSVLAYFLGGEVLALIFLVWAVRLLLARQITARLGGYTGDCLGAIQQVSEVAFYLGLLALLVAQG